MANSAFTTLMTFVDQNMGETLIQSSGNLISSIAPVFSAGFGIYLLMIAFSYWAGTGIQEMAIDFFKRMIVWSFLIFCAFNAAQYSDIANTIYGLDGDLTSALSLNNAGYQGNTLDQLLDKIDQIVEPLEQKYDDTEFYDLGEIIKLSTAINGIKFFTGLLLSICFGFFLVAKICLALILMVGPLFIGFSLFPVTRQLASNWMFQCLNYIIACVLLGVAGTFQIKLIETFMSQMGSGGGVVDVIAALGFLSVLFFATVVYIVLIFNIPQIASALTGGASIAGHARMLGNSARSGAGMTISTAKGTRATYQFAKKHLGGGKGGNIKNS